MSQGLKGLGAIRDAANNSANMLKIESGASAVVRILVPAEELNSVYEYTLEINGQWNTITQLPKGEDPLSAAGYKASFKTYIPVWDYADKKVKIFKASKTVGIQLLGLVDEYGDLTKRDFKITRQGEKLKTAYQFFARDQAAFEPGVEIVIPNIEDMIKPLTRDAVIALMNGINVNANSGGDSGGSGGNDNSNTGNNGGGTGGGAKKDDFPF